MLEYFDYKDYARLTPASISLDNDIDFEDMPIDEAFTKLGTPGLEIAEIAEPDTFEEKPSTIAGLTKREIAFVSTSRQPLMRSVKSTITVMIRTSKLPGSHKGRITSRMQS